MGLRVIERRDWSEFARGFSRRYEGWLISVAVERGAGDRHFVARDVPLRGVVAESNGDVSSMMVFTGDTTPHMTHFIDHPLSMTVDETADGVENALTILNSDESRTTIQFRSPMRPELIDGIA